jgi:hypothetical protein
MKILNVYITSSPLPALCISVISRIQQKVQDYRFVEESILSAAR